MTLAQWLTVNNIVSLAEKGYTHRLGNVLMIAIMDISLTPILRHASLALQLAPAVLTCTRIIAYLAEIQA